MKRPMLGKVTRWLIAGILTGVGALLVVTVYGQEIRFLMGQHTHCRTGESTIIARHKVTKPRSKPRDSERALERPSDDSR